MAVLGVCEYFFSEDGVTHNMCRWSSLNMARVGKGLIFCRYGRRKFVLRGSFLMYLATNFGMPVVFSLEIFSMVLRLSSILSFRPLKVRFHSVSGYDS